MTLTDAAAAPRRRTAVVWLACLLILGVRTAFLVKRGYVDGNLADPVPYDDISYFSDALSRLNVLHASGIGTFLHDLGASPPHAVLSTAAAMLGFALSGNATVAPYLVNAILVGVLLIPIVTLVELPPLASIGAFLAVVFAPFVDWAIMAFRPDFITGLMVAAVAAHLLFSDPSQQKPRRAFLLGCLGGACLLSKPTASPAVAGLLIVAAVLVVVGNAIASRQKSEAVKTHLAQGVLFSGLFLATSGLIFAIYLFFGWRELLSYIRTVMLDSPDIFALKLSLWDHIAYYLNLDALMLGYPGRPLALSAIVLIFAWLAGQKVNQISKIFLYVLFLGAAYILITLPSVKTFFFGGIFYAGSLVLLTICLCCLISFAVEKRQLAFVYLALPVIAILNIVNYTDAQPKRDISIIRISSLILDQVDDAIKHDLSLHSNRDGNRSNIRLLVVYPNPVADRDFLFRLLQAGYLAESLEGLYINKDLHYWNNLALSADYTVVPDERIVGTFPIGGLPITALAPQVNEFMKTAAGAVLVKDVETPDGHVYVYRRSEAAPGLPAR